MSAECYELTWPGKADARREIQKTAAVGLMPDRAGSVNFDAAANVLLEGDNLDALRLLQTSYFGKIRLIYLDPPYNTGSDSFVYPDNFRERQADYARRAGLTDERGAASGQDVWRKNSRENGHFHSVWLSMMYPRLYFARNLLREDGLIFVSIDDNEAANLRLLMDEIFGEENYRNTIIIRRGAKNVQRQFETIDRLGSGYEYALMYSKRPDIRFRRQEKALGERKAGTWNNHWRGTDRPTMRYELFGITPERGQWRWSKARSLAAIENYRRMLRDLDTDEQRVTQEEIDRWFLAQDGEIALLRLSKHGKPEHYIPPTDTTLLNDVWFDIPPNSTSALTALFGFKPFDNPKPLELIERCLAFTDESDIILDFFAGSGTTGQAVLEYNRKQGGQRSFILAQMPEPCDERSEAFQAGFRTIADITRERLRRVCLNMNQEGASSGFKAFRLGSSAFPAWDGGARADALLRQLAAFRQPVSREDADRVLYEALLKFGLPLSACVEPFAAGTPIFAVNQREAVIALDALDDAMIARIHALAPQRVICGDWCFASDSQKMNACFAWQAAHMLVSII